MKKIERVENLMRFMLSPGIGSIGMSRLLQHFGDSDAILGASEERLRQVSELRPAQISAVLRARTLDPRPEIDAVAAKNIDLLSYDDPAYPAALLNIADPPFLLYVKGQILDADQQALGIVGARACSRYGREQCERFAAGLARIGYCIVSGMARGIDTCAHRGALAVEGRTIAFVGCGLNHVYPPENRDLMAEIAAHGAVVSEFPLDTAPAAANFPRRNRLIAGLSLGILVVEASEKSGSLITARQAAEMGREVFAIPGRIDQDECSGCHKLIRDGAVLVRNLEDILDELPIMNVTQTAAAEAEISDVPVADSVSSADTAENMPSKKTTKNTAKSPAVQTTVAVNAEQQRILDALAVDTQVHIDELAVTLGTTAAALLSKLLIMELRGLVKQLPGKFFSLRR